jgi:hypothetical protein
MIILTIDRESIRHSIFMSGVRRSMFAGPGTNADDIPDGDPA